MSYVPLQETAPVVDPSSADGVFSLLWVIIALPALGAAVILLLGNTRTTRWAHLLGCGTVIGSFVISLVSFFALARTGTRTTGRSARRSTPGSRPAASRSTWGCSTTRSRRCSCC